MSEHGKKRRSRENDDGAAERKRKRSKRDVHTNGDHERPTDPEPVAPAVDEELLKREKKTKKKKKQRQEEGDQDARAENSRASPVLGEETKETAGEDGHHQDTRVEEVRDGEKKKKKRKHKKHAEEEVPEPMDVDAEEPVVEDAGHKTRKKSKKAKKTQPEVAVEDVDHGEAVEEVASEAKRKKKDEAEKKHKHEAVDAEQVVTFPFYTQTVSLYVPLYPQGFAHPITAARKQHLDPMLNHYSLALCGVPLAYHNVRLGERPMRADAANLPTDDTRALLRAVDEYAVGFGHVTADFDMFMPRRGAWMEGRMNLQTDGHIGLVCFDRFNASIEAKRLPRGWKWVDEPKQEQPADQDLDMVDHDGAAIDQDTSAVGDEDALLKVGQLHSSGYWADEAGERVAGMIRFRIQAFDSGTSGDHGYLSIRGTMLVEETERKLAAEERAVDRARRAKLNPLGLLRPMARRLPEYSVTRFEPEEEEGAGTSHEGA